VITKWDSGAPGRVNKKVFMWCRTLLDELLRELKAAVLDMMNPIELPPEVVLK
jgi:hypothetical protein